MTIKKPLIDPLTEWVIEKGWQLSCRFIREIEDEFECQDKFPISPLLASQNLVIKWLEFARRN